MDLVPFFDSYGEAGTALLGGAVLGAVFGFIHHETRLFHGFPHHHSDSHVVIYD